MANERLRDALLRRGLTPEHAATALNVDAKTVERWITRGRTPYPKHRHALAALLRESESFLWPDAVDPERRSELAGSEIVRVFPHRNSIPTDLWDRLINDAKERVEILAHAALFLVERPKFIKELSDKAANGARVRLLFGDPDSPSVALRGAEEQLGDGTLAARIRNALTYYRPLQGVDGVEIRFHDATLYNSIFCFDDEMIVNMHVYGFQGAHAPSLNLRRISSGDLFDTYSESFETIWRSSHPADF